MEFGLFFLMQRDEAWSERSVREKAVDICVGTVEQVAQPGEARVRDPRRRVGS